MRHLRRLRPEEGLLVLGFVVSSLVTIYANVDLATRGVSSRRIEGGLVRLGAVVLLAGLVLWIHRYLHRTDAGSRPRQIADEGRVIGRHERRALPACRHIGITQTRHNRNAGLLSKRLSIANLPRLSRGSGISRRCMSDSVAMKANYINRSWIFINLTQKLGYSPGMKAG